MRRLLLVFAMHHMASATTCRAQNWASINVPGNFSDWGAFHNDTAYGKLQVTGMNQVTPGWYAGVYEWDGAQWDTLGVFHPAPRSVIRYHDTLLVAGGFLNNDEGTPLPRIAYLDPTGWQPYGAFNGGINRLRIIDGELYAVGGFELVDGQTCDGIVKRVGGHWEPVGDFGEVPSPNLFDVIKYDGKLVACGNMSIVGETYRDVYLFENGEWGPLGGGLFGTQSGGWVMAEYNGELILGGGFFISAGNAGQGIMRWNGSIWQPLGVGLTVTYNSYQYTPQVYALTVRDGKLFVGGGFNFAGHVPAQGIAVWDGDVWCGLGSDLMTVHDIVFYNDTLLAMCNNNTVDGQDISGGVRYLHPTYDDTCSLGTGMAINEWPAELFAAYAEHSQLQVTGLRDGTSSYSIIAPSGQTVRAGQVLAGGGRCEPVPISALRPGVYLLCVRDHGTVRFVVGE